MHVHDHGLFVAVQLLEDTLAVPQLGKLCEEHRSSYEWASGQQPRLTKKGEILRCKTDNFVPPVVPEVSSSTGTCSSSTSSLQASSFTSPETEGSDEPAPGKWRPENQKQNKKKDDNRDAEERLRDLLEWLEEFTDNLETQKRLLPAHISQDSDSQRPTKVAERSRKHNIFTHFQKDRNCEVCMRTKITKAPCRRRTGEAVPRAEKFGDLITADQKVLNEESESRNNHRYAIVVQDLATQWIQSYPRRTQTEKMVD